MCLPSQPKDARFHRLTFDHAVRLQVSTQTCRFARWWEPGRCYPRSTTPPNPCTRLHSGQTAMWHHRWLCSNATLYATWLGSGVLTLLGWNCILGEEDAILWKVKEGIRERQGFGQSRVRLQSAPARQVVSIQQAGFVLAVESTTE